MKLFAVINNVYILVYSTVSRETPMFCGVLIRKKGRYMNQENRFGANLFSLHQYTSQFHLPYSPKANGSNYSMGCVALSRIINLPDVLNASSGLKMLPP